ncbi:7496_t:CDS:2 [Paraglomus occultum]|uniref:7496_t:CDS:1 n=1 Tax=Paraglomus occultum TaxID=144539 RepID=A0A9N9C258_9GLOM|nr:7496_t:CDS:2 [Paraglomus occultum]
MPDLMHEPLEIEDPPSAKPLEIGEREIGVPSGHTVAISGPSGGGKYRKTRTEVTTPDTATTSIIDFGSAAFQQSPYQQVSTGTLSPEEVQNIKQIEVILKG